MAARVAVDVNAVVLDTGSEPAAAAGFAFPTGVLTAAGGRELARPVEPRRWPGWPRHAAAPDAGGRTPSDLPLVQLGAGARSSGGGAVPGADRRVAAGAVAGRVAVPRAARRRVGGRVSGRSWCFELRGRGGRRPGYAAPGRRCSTGTRTCGPAFVADDTAGTRVPGRGRRGSRCRGREVDLSGLARRCGSEALERARWPPTARRRFDLARPRRCCGSRWSRVGADEYRLVLDQPPHPARRLVHAAAGAGAAGAVRRGGDATRCRAARPYRDYLAWLAGRDRRGVARGVAAGAGGAGRADPARRRRRDARPASTAAGETSPASSTAAATAR